MAVTAKGWAAAAGALTVAVGLCGAAWAYCGEPAAPDCVSRYGAFVDDFELIKCRRELERYRTEVEEHLVCVQSEYRLAVSSFNLRAQRR